MEDKKWFKSKTLWVNVIAIAAVLLQCQIGFEITGDEQLALLAVINMLLRLFTHTGVVRTIR